MEQFVRNKLVMDFMHYARLCIAVLRKCPRKRHRNVIRERYQIALLLFLTIILPIAALRSITIIFRNVVYSKLLIEKPTYLSTVKQV